MIKPILKLLTAFLLLNIIAINLASAQKVTILQQGKTTSIRGLSVVNEKVAWVSGSKGYIALTKDAGKTWNWQQVKGFEQSDFRDIQAFSEKEAVIMSSGTPAVILKTVDAGATWLIKYRNRDTTIFLDAMDFDGKHGYLLGDPVDNHFVLFETLDKGNTWKQKDQSKTPMAKPGEAAFAASGSCLSFNNKNVSIVTGGSLASFIYQPKPGKGWVNLQLPIAQGKSSAGAFSLDQHGKHWLVAGGDYQRDNRLDSTLCLSTNAGKTWFVGKFPTGFQSCIIYVNDKTYISTGTSGTNLSKDNGLTWTKIDDVSYNVCAKSGNGKWVLLAGNNGKIAIFQPLAQRHRFGIFKLR
jgi:photosystem II stability/assembly factor-like uncharacterized protein